MKTLGTLLLCAAVLAMPAQSGAADLKLCKDVAAKLRADRAFAAPGSKLFPLEALAKSRSVEVASSSHNEEVSDENADAYIAALVSKYHPDKKLAATIKDQISNQDDEVWSLAGSDVHALTSTGGSAHCSQFLFFEAGNRLPDPPASMQGGLTDDTSGPIFECYHSRGDLVRIGGRIVFAATDIGFENDGYGLRLTPLEHGSWETACHISTGFEIRYTATTLHVAQDGPLGREDATKLALALASAKDAADDAKRPFSFGPSIAGHTALMAAVGAVKSGMLVLPESFPLSGNTEDMVELDTSNSVENIGMIVGGRDYLLGIGHPAIGWRDMPGYLMIIYELKGNMPVPVASAEVRASKGPLKSVTVSELKS